MPCPNRSVIITTHRYPDVDVYDLERRCTIEDVCDFVVKYIESDVLGLLADRHLTIAGKEPSPCISINDFEWV